MSYKGKFYVEHADSIILKLRVYRFEYSVSSSVAGFLKSPLQNYLEKALFKKNLCSLKKK